MGKEVCLVKLLTRRLNKLAHQYGNTDVLLGWVIKK